MQNKFHSLDVSSNILKNEFDKHIYQCVSSLRTSLDETQAYIYSIFRNYIRADNDLSKKSVTLVYADAKSTLNFAELQNLGDWIFFVRTIFPDSLVVSAEYYDTIARSSYYRCYRILDGKWKVFEELSDSMPLFVENYSLPILWLGNDGQDTKIS